MNINAIRHDRITGCYAYDKDTLIIRLETGTDASAVSVYANDPYANGFGEKWRGEKLTMKRKLELKHSIVWETEVKPKYKRLQYYFEIESGDERACLFDDGPHTDLNALAGKSMQYFKFAWLNEADICTVPEWAKSTVWYQIFPDRFCRAAGVNAKTDKQILAWGDESKARFDSFYGGNIRGIIEKLEYVKDLGVNGLYLTPIMLSDTNHRYNVHDYTTVDPMLGSRDDLTELIDKAHGMGIKIMLDAVFNHCGYNFFAWRDVMQNGKKSKYYDWFFINSDDFIKPRHDTLDGRYYSFSFAAYMPKLNTNNREVADYLIGVCKDWVTLGVDGIRFDVGNEVSHAFLKKLRLELKALKPDLFLLGEIWHRSLPWLMGDEYDSIMNFQFLNAVNDFYTDKQTTARDLAYAVNENYGNYYRQVNGVLFNMLDNHDVDRAVTRCNSVDALLQELVLLMTMPGSPSVYYGTEVALRGEVRESHNRRCMPWREISEGKCEGIISEFKQITALRKYFTQLGDGDIDWKLSDDNARLVHYAIEGANGKRLEVYLNASDKNATVVTDMPIIYSRLRDGKTLLPYGIVVLYK